MVGSFDSANASYRKRVIGAAGEESFSVTPEELRLATVERGYNIGS